MLILGLTGGIGSGKSTALAYFATLGASIISADKITKELTQKDSPYFKKIVKHFGKKIVTVDGELNRDLIKNIIFNSATKRKWLEELLHPAIAEHITKELTKITTPYCIIEIPLLLEKGTSLDLDRIIVIDTDEATQIMRTKDRDNCDEKLITNIIATQANRTKRLQTADDVINNSSDIKTLEAQITALHEKYLRLAG